MGETTNFKFPYPAPTGKVSEGAKDFEELANKVDSVLSTTSPLRIVSAASSLTAEAGTVISCSAAITITLPAPVNGARIDVANGGHSVEVQPTSPGILTWRGNGSGSAVHLVLREPFDQFVSFICIGSTWYATNEPGPSKTAFSASSVTLPGEGRYYSEGATGEQTVTMPLSVGKGAEVEIIAAAQPVSVNAASGQSFRAVTWDGQLPQSLTGFQLRPYQHVRLLYVQGSVWQQVAGTHGPRHEWGSVGATGTVTVGSLNYTVSHLGTGRYKIAWEPAFVSASSYGVLITQEESGQPWVVDGTKHAESCEINTSNVTGTLRDTPFAFQAIGS